MSFGYLRPFLRHFERMGMKVNNGGLNRQTLGWKTPKIRTKLWAMRNFECPIIRKQRKTKTKHGRNVVVQANDYAFSLIQNNSKRKPSNP